MEEASRTTSKFAQVTLSMFDGDLTLAEISGKVRHLQVRGR